MNFSKYSSKLEKQQKERSEKHKRDLEREKREQERVKQNLARIEEEKRIERLRAKEQEEEAILRAEADREKNKGVYFLATLRPASFNGADKGVIRAADKISLPASARVQLSAQGAEEHGLMFMELVAGSRRTHAAVLEFTAQEGTVGLPPTLVQRLGGDEIDSVQVKYTQLQKGTYAKLQPIGHEFQKHIVNIKETLEASLMLHSALTVGDPLMVTHDGQTYEVRVKELHPETQVSVIETDVEVDLATSVEAEEYQRAAAEEERRRVEEAERALQLAREAEVAAAARAADVARWRQQKAATLPAEPPQEAPGVVSCAVRLPEGRRVVRRMLPGDLLQLLFDFIDVAGSEEPNSYNIASSYPRRVWELARDGPKTLEQVGMKGPQEALFIERAPPTIEEDS
ncbi:hypothetical protein CYMTET_5633 [Cymbomonas tetramitiformis]|uniref:UBX domain-containing protein n=1 Tax=Cymbomonas tetramitiformis TaxID=36881 RepID=A0AAE0GZ08_9CHLO|nr:hypothetical protein CYMTET_5633 [Cymbomonas tetramitiformis]